MRFAICDDNQLFLKDMQRQLKEMPMVGEVDAFSDLEAFWEAVEYRKRAPASFPRGNGTRRRMMPC